MEDVVIAQIASALAKVRPGACEGLTLESTLDSLAFDSLDRITLLFELEDRLGVSIPDAEARALRSVGDIVACVRRLQDTDAARA